jgi:uncharacterized protein (DUF1697 family)
MKYIAFLRGINVGGNSLIKMAELKIAVEKCGFTNVRTFIQSGNVLFDSPKSTKAVVTVLEKELSREFGMNLKVVVRTKADIESVLKHAPKTWKKDDLRKYIAFVRAPKTAEDVVAEMQLREGVDSADIGKGVVYMSTKLSGITKSGFTKLASKAIYKEITIRNYTTVKKLIEIIAG